MSQGPGGVLFHEDHLAERQERVALFRAVPGDLRQPPQPPVSIPVFTVRLAVPAGTALPQRLPAGDLSP